MRNPSVLQRCFRDMCVGTQHIFVDPRTFDEMGKGLLGVGPANDLDRDTEGSG